MAPKPRKKDEEGFQFNFFWIYAIVGAILLLGAFSNFGENTKSITSAEFKEMMTNGDVLAVRVIGQKSALVYLTDSSLKKSKYSEEAKGKFGGVNQGPHFSSPYLQTMHLTL